MLIFSNTPGVVAAHILGQALPFSIAIGGAGGPPAFPIFQTVKSVLTGFTLDNESGLGVSSTLRDRIYVYVHNERPGSVTISGVAFGGVCGSTGPTYTGIDGVYAYYERVRASTEGLPVRLVFGPRTTLVGFMSGLTLGVEDADTGVGGFRFKFVSMPRNTGRQFGYKPPLPWELDAASIPSSR